LEIGANYKLKDIGSFSLTGFLKDNSDQFDIQTVIVSSGSGNEVHQYPQTSGKSRQRGVELTGEFSNRSGFKTSFSYSFVDSDADLSSTLSSYVHEHRLVSLVEYRLNTQTGSVLDELGLIALVTYTSGHPIGYFRPTSSFSLNPQDAGMHYSSVDPRTRRPSNGESTPSNFQMDARVDKHIKFGALGVNVFVYAQNIFNTRNVSNVYPGSGKADDDGFLSNPDVSSGFVNSLGPRYVELYRAINLQNGQAYRRATGTSLWGSPRQIRFGVRIDV
jgi:hypothetical protein